MISAEKERQLQERLERLGIREEDLVEKFIRGTGSGGQKINKTSSTVYLKHEPTGIEVRSQAGRSQAMNRYDARMVLCERLEEEARQRKLEKKRQIALRRVKNRKRSKGEKRKLMEFKKRRGEIKKLRGKI